MTTFTPSVNFDLSSQKQNAGFEALTVTDPIVFKDVNLAIKEASTTNKGILNTGIQTINGVKTFVELPICDKIADTNIQLVNKGYVDQAVKMGLTWKRPIKGFWDFNVLPDPYIIGDRYIATTNVTELTTKDYIYEYLGDDNLREIVAVEGMTLYNDANTGQFANQAITFDGTAWVNIGNVITYGSLIGKPNQDLNTTNNVTFNNINGKTSISLEHETSTKKAILMTRNSTAKTVSIALQSDPSGEAEGDFALINNDNGALTITSTNNLNLTSNDGIISCSTNQLTTGSLKMNGTTPIINGIKTSVVASNINDTSLITEQASVRYNDNSNWILGFVNNVHSKISISGSTFTIEPATGYSSFSYYCEDPADGIIKMYTKTTAQTVSVISGGLVYYYGGTLTVSNTFNPQIIKRYALVAYINRYASVNTIFADERHTIGMDALTHYNLHNTIGSKLLSGGTIDLTLNNTSATGISITPSILLDEDLEHTLEYKETTDNMRVLRFVGTDEGGINITFTDAIGPFTLSGTTLQRNAFIGGEWTLSPISNNNYVLGHVLATNSLAQDDGSTGYTRYMGLLGQNQYGNANSAREGALNEIKNMYLVGIPLPEFVFIGTVIYQQDGSDIKLVAVDGSGSKYIDWRDKTINATGITPSSHSALSGLSNDDHPQYALVTGRSNETLTAHAISSGAISGTSLATKYDGVDALTLNSGEFTSTISSTGNLKLEALGSGGISTDDVTTINNQATIRSLTLQPASNHSTNILTVKAPDTTDAFTINANKLSTAESLSTVGALSVGTQATARGFHSKWLKITDDVSTFLTSLSQQKIYVTTATHTLYMPIHSASMEGYTYEISCGPDVTSCAIRVQKSGNNKALSVGGEDVVLYANQKIKVTLMDSAGDDGYGIWQVSVKPTWGMFNQHFSYIGNADRNITETSFTILYSACKLTLPPGKWLITLESAVYVAGANSSGNLALAKMTGETTFDIITRTYMGYYSNSAAGMTFQYCTSTIETITTESIFTFVGKRNGTSTINIPNSGDVRLRFDAFRLR